MLQRCDDCGGLVSGRYNGFEAVCRCFSKTRNKRKPLFKEIEKRKRVFEESDQDVEAIVKGTVGVDPDL